MQKRKVFLSFLISMFAFATGAILLFGKSSPQITVSQLKAKIESALPYGSNQYQVASFLDSNSITNSGYFEAKEYSLEKGNYVEERMVYASISKVERNLLTYYSIYMRFYFDEDRKLTDYTFQRLEDK